MKKVLASVLAGSMVLGMASMASAATLATLVKKDKSSDYDFEYYAYEPDGEYVAKKDLTGILDEVTLDAFDAYDKAYKAADKAAKSSANLTEAEYARLAENLQNAYVNAYTAVARDSYLTENADEQCVKDAVEDFLDAIGVGSGSTASAVKGNFEDYIDNAVTLGGSGATVTVASGKISGPVFYAQPSAVKDRPTLRALLAIAPKEGAFAAAFLGLRTAVGAGVYVIGNRASLELKDGAGRDFNLYTYGDDCDEITIRLAVAYDEDFRVDVANGPVTVSRRRLDRTEANRLRGIDLYDITVKAAAGPRVFELTDYKIEFDCADANRVFYLEGDVAYSDYRDVAPDERYIVKSSIHTDLHDDGSIFNFGEVLDEETRIICNNYVDVLLKGNYGTDFENLRVIDDDIKEVEDFFQDYDIDYYDFVGTPKFAKDVTVRVDADSDSYIYEFDKKTGDVVDITDECEYTSDGWTFKRKSLKTYVVLEEPYEGGNVRAEKEPVDTEPIDEPDDTDATGSKPNPGTGAMPF